MKLFWNVLEEVHGEIEIDDLFGTCFGLFEQLGQFALLDATKNDRC